jgi:hypothetical protein
MLDQALPDIVFCFVFHDYGLADSLPKVASTYLTQTADSAVVYLHGSSV